MSTARPRRISMAVAACLLSLPLTVWVVSRVQDGQAPLTAPRDPGLVSVTPPPGLAEWPPDLATDTPGEPADPVPDRPAGADAPPLKVHVALATAPPATLRVAVPTEHPPVETVPPPAAAPPQGWIAAELETRARGDLQRLEGLESSPDSPLGRVASLFTFLEQQQCAGGSCQAAQRVSEAYLHARAEVLRAMLEAFLASDGRDDGAREYQALQTLHADFTAEMAVLAAHVPMLAGLPEVLATTLRVPDYLEAPEDDPQASQ